MSSKSTGIYLRISDDREGRELGVQRQEEDCRELLQRLHDAKLGGVYRDNDIGASTRSKKRRPDFDRLLDDARAGRINHVIAYTTSRLTRRPREFEDLIELAEKHGVSYTYVRSPSFDLNTAAGRMIARVLAARDAAEAEELGERVTRKRQEMRESGGYLGGPRPFGWEPGEREPRQWEAEVLRGMAHRVLAGIAVYAVTRELNDAAVPTAGNAAKWSPTAIRGMLLRPGTARLLGETTALAVRAVLEDPARRTSPGNQPRWLGSRIYRCGVCQAPSLVVSGKLYACRPATGDLSRHVFRNARLVDDYVEWALVAHLARPDARDLFVAKRPEVDVQALHAEALTVKEKLAELEDMLGDGELTREAYRRQVARVEQRRASVQTELVAAGGVDPVADLINSGDVVQAWFGTGPDRQGGYSVEQRRAILRGVAQVTIFPATLRGAGGFDATSVEILIPKPAD